MSAALVVTGCGASDPTGVVVAGVEFPQLSQQLLSDFCIRGEIVPPVTVTGDLTNADCGTTGVFPVRFEGWRVRVPRDQSVTFEGLADSSLTSDPFSPTGWEMNYKLSLELAELEAPHAEPPGWLVLSASPFRIPPLWDHSVVARFLAPETEYVIFLVAEQGRFSSTGSYELRVR
ncbi:MAG: hypothetical protein ACE5FJ_07830 [Gemmatimonadales bacterium]